MGSLEYKSCPLCGCGPAPKWEDEHALVNEYVQKDSHAGKWVDIDYPVDVHLSNASRMKAEALAIARYINKRYEDTGIRFDLKKIEELRIKI